MYFPKLIVHRGNREHIFGKKADLFYKTRLEMRSKYAMVWAMMRTNNLLSMKLFMEKLMTHTVPFASTLVQGCIIAHLEFCPSFLPEPFL